MWKKILSVVCILGTVFAVAAEDTGKSRVLLEDAVINVTAGEENCTLVWEFTVNNRQEEAVIQLVSGPVALTETPQITCYAPGFWQRRPVAEIIIDDGIPALHIKGRGWVDVRIVLAAGVETSGSRRSLTLDFPGVAGSVSGNIEGCGENIAAPVIKNSVRNDRDGTLAWDLDSMEIAWQVLEGGNIVQQEVIQRLQGTINVYAGMEAISMHMLAEGNVTAGEISSAVWQIPSGWHPVKAAASVQLKGWSFDEEKGTLHLDFAEALSGEYTLDIEFVAHMAGLPGDFTVSAPDPGIVNFNTKWRFDTAPGLVLECLENGSLVRTADPAFEPKPLSAAGGGTQFYAAYGAGESARFHLAVTEPRITYESFVRISLGLERFTAKGDFKVNVAESGVQKLKILCDREWVFQELITGSGERVDVVSESCPGFPDMQYWVLELPQKLLGEWEFSILWERVAVLSEGFSSGAFTVADASGRGYAALICDPAVLPGTVTMSGVTEIPADALPVRNSRTVAAGVVRNEPWQISAVPQPAPQKAAGEIFDLYVMDVGRGRGMALFSLNCTGAPFEEMIFQFPAECGNIEFTASGNVKISGAYDAAGAPEGFVRKRITFAGRVSGALTLLASFELPGGEETPFTVGGISLTGGEITAIFSAVSGAPVMKVTAEGEIPGAKEIMPEELPSEYAALAGTRILRSWRLDNGTSIPVSVSSGRRAETLSAVIENADYSCRFADSGECILEGRYVIKNSSAQFLRFKLPAASEIWRLTVDGGSVQPFSDGEYTLVPLPLPESPLVPVTVEFSTAFTVDVAGREVKLPLPETDLNIISRRVNVDVPGGSTAESNNAENTFTGGLTAWFSPAVMPLVRKLAVFIPLAAGALIAALAAGIAFACRRKVAGIAGCIVLAGCIWGAVAALCNIIDDGLATNAPPPAQRIVFETFADFGEADNFVMLKLAADDGVTSVMWLLLAVGSVCTAAGIAMLFRRSLAGMLMTGAGVVLLMTGASLTLTGTVWAWVAVVLIMTVLLPFLAGTGSFRWKRGAVLLLIFCCAVGSFAAENPQIRIKSSQASLEIFDDALKSVWVYDLDAAAGSGTVIANAGTMVFPADIPDALLLDKDAAGSWRFTAIEDFSGKVELRQIVPLQRNGSDRTAILAFPAAVSNTVIADIPEIKINGSVCADAGQIILPAGGGAFTVTVADAALEGKTVPAVSRSENILFAPGAVYRYTDCRFRAARSGTGQVRIIPGTGWQVVDVHAEGLDYWNCSGDGTVTVYFLEPQKGEFNCTVESVLVLSAVESETCEIAPAKLPGAEDNGGTMEFSAAAGRRFSVLSAVDTVSISGDSGNRRYRFSSPDTAVWTVETAAVEAQLRVDTAVILRAEDERLTLDCDYVFEAVSGEVFEQKIRIPDGYEILNVTASEVIDWRSNDEFITIVFRRALRDNVCTVHCSFAAIGGIPEKISVPDPEPIGVSRRSGSVTVATGRGNTLKVVSRKGVSFPEISADGRDVSCRILESEWELEAECIAAKPWISAEQRTVVHLKPSAGEIKCTSDILVENNGIRSLLVQLPAGITDYEFEGRDIARTVAVGGDLVRIEFTRRIEGAYRLVCRLPLPAGESFTVGALVFPEASGTLAGKLAVTVSEGELLPSAASGIGITPMAQREFGMIDGAGSLPQEAWYTSGSQWSLQCAMVHNEGAAVSRITLGNVNIHSVVADTGVEIGRLYGEVTCNGAGFLIFRLPENSTLLAAGFNGIPAVPVYENGDMMLAAEEGRSSFFLEYTVKHDLPAAGEEFRLAAPGFAAPVAGICWRIAGTGGVYGTFVAGTLEPRTLTAALLHDFDAGSGDRWRHAAPGKMDQAQLQVLNSTLEKEMFYTSSPGARSDIYGRMLELNSVSNASNIAARQQKIMGASAAGEKMDVDMVAEKIFSSQHSLRTVSPVLRTSLPESDDYFLQVEGTMLTKPFAPVNVVIRRETNESVPGRFPGVVFVAAAAVLTAAALWFACRRRKNVC